MSRILTIIAAATLTLAASAQNYLIDNPDNKARFGARVGIDISSTSEAAFDSYNNGIGFTAGAVYDIPLWKNLYFQPGLSLFYNTFGETIYTTDHPADAPALPDDMPIPNYEGSFRNWGFRVPMNFGFHFDFTDDISIHLFTGPVFNLNLSCTEHFPDSSHSLMDNGFRRFDMQWSYGVGMTYDDNYYVSISGAAGLTRVYQTTFDHFKRNTFNISLGYNF